MEKELLYGKRQRIYTREWLAYVSGRPCYGRTAELARPCVVDQDWQRQLITELAQLLWEKVKLGKSHALPHDDAARCEPDYDHIPATGLLDFRFVNAARVDLDDPAIAARIDPRPQPAEYALNQYISRYVFDERHDLEALLTAHAARSLPQVQALCRPLTRVAAVDEGPELLFFPS